jgi:pre-mRNA 3'-end-processing factor FIP1
MFQEFVIVLDSSQSVPKAEGDRKAAAVNTAYKIIQPNQKYSLKRPTPAQTTADAKPPPQTPQISAFDIKIEEIEDKPWRKPGHSLFSSFRQMCVNLSLIYYSGSDITDYFNYGFNEDTWRQYCARQIQIRSEQQLQGKIRAYESKSKPSTFPPELQQPGFIEKQQIFQQQLQQQQQQQQHPSVRNLWNSNDDRVARNRRPRQLDDAVVELAGSTDTDAPHPPMDPANDPRFRDALLPNHPMLQGNPFHPFDMSRMAPPMPLPPGGGMPPNLPFFRGPGRPPNFEDRRPPPDNRGVPDERGSREEWERAKRGGDDPRNRERPRRDAGGGEPWDRSRHPSDRRDGAGPPLQQREGERRDDQMDRKEGVERMEGDRKEGERREGERREGERKEGERRESERRDSDKRESGHRDGERRESERSERRDTDRREREGERGRENDRREADRRETDRRESYGHSERQGIDRHDPRNSNGKRPREEADDYARKRRK